MADSGTAQEQPATGIEALKKHALENKLDMGMWAIRAASILFTFAYFIPIIGYAIPNIYACN